MMRPSWLLATVLFVGGCVSAPPVVPEAGPFPAEPAPRAPLEFVGCDELDYYLPEDPSGFDMGGLRPVYVDPAQRTVNLLLTAMACDQLIVGNASAESLRAFFPMISVEPHPTLRIPDVTAYVWIAGVATDVNLLVDGFGPRLARDNATVALTFTPLGSNDKAQATLRVTDGADTFGAQSAMVGQAASGTAGTMAAYIGNSETGLELYLVSFSDYRSYPTGVARGTGLSSLVPLTVAHDEVYPAYHNLDYDVIFALVGEE